MGWEETTVKRTIVYYSLWGNNNIQLFFLLYEIHLLVKFCNLLLLCKKWGGLTPKTFPLYILYVRLMVFFTGRNMWTCRANINRGRCYVWLRNLTLILYVAQRDGTSENCASTASEPSFFVYVPVFYPEDGGGMFLWNFGTYLSSDEVQCPIRSQSKQTQLTTWQCIVS
jgi:hypothetical protein